MTQYWYKSIVMYLSDIKSYNHPTAIYNHPTASDCNDYFIYMEHLHNSLNFVWS